MLCITQGLAIDRDCEIGMAYAKGERGVSMITREMPNCPYEKCAEVTNKNGTTTFTFAKKDLSSAVKYLYASTSKQKNKDAAKELVHILAKQLNWREPKADGYLLLKLKEDIGIDLKAYRSYFKKGVEVMVENGDCEGYVLAGDIAKDGALGEVYNPNKAKFMYKRARSTCAKDSFFGMTIEQKINALSTTSP